MRENREIERRWQEERWENLCEYEARVLKRIEEGAMRKSVEAYDRKVAAEEAAEQAKEKAQAAQEQAQAKERSP